MSASARRAPGDAAPSGRRTLRDLSAPTVENWPQQLPDFAAAPPVDARWTCPQCREPFDTDDDRYYSAGCLGCGWRRHSDLVAA
jgi:hypothetical protein